MTTKKSVTNTKVKEKEKVSEKETPATQRKHVADAVAMELRSGKERRQGDRRLETQPVAVERRQTPRRVKVNRRRQIDPTTCERDYTPEEIEFMTAMDVYKRQNGRMFPTCSEILEVIKKMGYEKRPVALSGVGTMPEFESSDLAEQAV
jgi:hypothetical protein